MQRLQLVLTTMLLLAASGEARADSTATSSVRDCIPINGRYGYYGNPWCDPTSLTNSRSQRVMRDTTSYLPKDSTPKTGSRR